MSVYERLYQVHYNRNVNAYVDTAREIREIDESTDGGVECVWKGYADEEYIGPGHPQYRGIEGTLYTRRQVREVPRKEWELLARQEAARELLYDLAIQTAGSTIYVSAGEYRAPTLEEFKHACPEVAEGIEALATTMATWETTAMEEPS